jgi:adenylosuccinate synthase
MISFICNLPLRVAILFIRFYAFLYMFYISYTNSKYTVICGAQAGDEGKGKETNYLIHKAVKKRGPKNVVVISPNGGSNAGHTTKIRNKIYHTHFLPTGVLERGVINYCGNNKVLNPRSLMREIAELSVDYPDLLNYVWFSERIHVTLLPQVIVDHGKMGSDRGTTKQGIGPTYAARCFRTGLRLADLLVLNEEQLKVRLKDLYDSMGMMQFGEKDIVYSATNQDGQIINITRQQLYTYEYDLESIRWIIKTLGPRIVPSGFFKKELLKSRGKHYIFEMSNAFMLDLTFGTYPDVTATSCVSGAILESCGLSIQDTFKYNFKNNFECIGVAKSYPTRVGKGVLPTLMVGEDAHINDEIIVNGGEVGVTTGRPRRAAWPDACMLVASANINGITRWNNTRGDNMENCDTVKFCIGYKFPNGEIRYAHEFVDYPATINELETVTPVYITLDGWKGANFSTVRSYKDLHPNFKKYLAAIKQYTGIPVKYVNTGQEQSQIIEI